MNSLDNEPVCLQAMRALALEANPEREVRVLVIGDVHDTKTVEHIRQALDGKLVDGAHVSVLGACVPSRAFRTLVVDESDLIRRQLAEAIKSIEIPSIGCYAPEAENKPWYRQHAQRGRRRAY
jgi:hypothetical protein